MRAQVDFTFQDRALVVGPVDRARQDDEFRSEILRPFQGADIVLDQFAYRDFCEEFHQNFNSPPPASFRRAQSLVRVPLIGDTKGIHLEQYDDVTEAVVRL